MKAVSLLLSLRDDLNALALAWGLRQNEIEPLFGQSVADPAFGSWSIVAAPREWSGPGALGNREVRSVWCYRPQPPKALSETHAEDVDFVESEWLLFQRNVFALSRQAVDALWVNDYNNAIRTENKLIQLQAARRLGIEFPETLVSNDPDAVRAFVRKHGKVIYKPFFAYGWIDKEAGRGRGSVVSVLDDIASIEDASIAMCPGIYQPYVEKVCDLRVTVIGDRFFPVRITANQDSAFIDWRPRTQMPDLTAEPFELPMSYQARLAHLMRELGIVYGCIDLAADASGNLHFFEVNQGGQFLFVEQWIPELPLFRALCAMLAQGRTNYSLEGSADVSYRRFRETDEYARWLTRQREWVAKHVTGKHPTLQPTT